MPGRTSWDSSTSLAQHATKDANSFRQIQALALRNGERQVVYLENGEQYRGSWKDGMRHGWGTYTYKNGDKYEGEWAADKREGKGTFWVKHKQSMTKRYEGSWLDDHPHGDGTCYQPDGSVYTGRWQHELRHGRGLQKYACKSAEGDIYEGEWLHDLRYGWGKMRYANGDVYEGQWHNDMKNGPGQFTFADGKQYEGLWSCDIAKCGTYSQQDPSDENRLPELKLLDPTRVLKAAIAAHRCSTATTCNCSVHGGSSTRTSIE